MPHTREPLALCQRRPPSAPVPFTVNRSRGGRLIPRLSQLLALAGGFLLRDTAFLLAFGRLRRHTELGPHAGFKRTS